LRGTSKKFYLFSVPWEKICKLLPLQKLYGFVNHLIWKIEMRNSMITSGTDSVSPHFGIYEVPHLILRCGSMNL